LRRHSADSAVLCLTLEQALEQSATPLLAVHTFGTVRDAIIGCAHIWSNPRCRYWLCTHLEQSATPLLAVHTFPSTYPPFAFHPRFMMFRVVSLLYSSSRYFVI
jgi:hypothetical protein